MSEALELDIGDLRLAALAWGRPRGRPVLAMHGWLDNAATMTELAPRLCAALDLRIVSLDLPGHGLSEHKRGPYHFIDYTADVIHAADALGWQQFSLLGHSMGAGVATLVMGTVPERIERCVLIEGLGPMTEEPEHAARRLARSLRAEVRKQDSQKRLFDSPEAAATRLREAAPMSMDSAQILIARGLVEVDGGYSWRADPRLRLDSRVRLTETQLAAFLQASRCPVLLLRALQGWPFDAKILGARAALLAQLEVQELEGKHHLHLDDAASVAAQVLAFFTRTLEDA